MCLILSQQLGDYEIAWVDAEVGKTESGMLSLLPFSAPAPPHKSVLVGDIKMSDFKQFLASKGIQVCQHNSFTLDFFLLGLTILRWTREKYFCVQAEFSGGALRCGEFVTLRKVGDPSQKVRCSLPIH